MALMIDFASTTACIFFPCESDEISRIRDKLISIMLNMTKHRTNGGFQPIGAVLRRLTANLTAQRNRKAVSPQGDGTASCPRPALASGGGEVRGQPGETVASRAGAATNVGDVRLGEDAARLKFRIAKAAKRPCHGRPSVGGSIIGPTPHVEPPFDSKVASTIRAADRRSGTASMMNGARSQPCMIDV